MSEDQTSGADPHDPWRPAAHPPTGGPGPGAWPDAPGAPTGGSGEPLPFAPPPGYVPTSERSAPNLPTGPTDTQPPPGGWGPPPQGGWGPPPQGGWGPPQGPYGYGYPAYGYPQQTTTEKGATRSLVLGIISLIICGVILGPAAIYEGVAARKRIRESGGALTGDGLAIAGIVLGTIGVVAAVLILIVTFSSSGSSSGR
jgi:hypothetical protein